MNATLQIKSFENLLGNCLPENTFIRKCIFSDLVGPGENYGSILMGVTIEVEEPDTKKYTELQFVAKTPPSNEIVKQVFQTSITFKKEIAMYETIIPTLIQFQKEHGVNTLSFFPSFKGARISLIPESTEVDDDAVLLLDNLKFSGFSLADRMESLNLSSTKLILAKLAKLHATTVAVKMVKPELFKSKILPHLHLLDISDSPFKDIEDIFIQNILKTAKLTDDCIPLIPQIVKAMDFSRTYENAPPSPQEPFASLIHCDFWINNVLLKFIEEEPVEAKFVDFQHIQYGSPAMDVVFFFYTSVQFQIIHERFDELLRYYYDVFIATLKSLECDVQPFSYSLFLQEVEKAAKIQFWHILHMLSPIFTPKGEVIDIDKVMSKHPDPVKHVPEKYNKRLADIILDFNKRNWI